MNGDENSDGGVVSEVATLRGQVDELGRLLRRARSDADQIRSVILLTASWVSGVLVVLGLVTPYVTDVTTGAYGQSQTHTYPLVAIFAVLGNERGDPAVVVAEIGFVGLVVVALLSLFVMKSITGRRSSSAFQRYAKVLSILLLIGGTVPLLLEIFNPSVSHTGPVFLMVGAVIFAMLTCPGQVRGWWVSDPRPRR